jgi:hypothetical protein
MSQDATQIEEFSLAQIFEKYKNKWVAMTVTKRDSSLQPTSGRVVAYDNDRYRLRQKIAQMNDVCILYAGEPQYPLCL